MSSNLVPVVPKSREEQLRDVMMEYYNSGRIEWHTDHCKDQHGVIYRVAGNKEQLAIQKILEYFHFTYWWKKSPNLRGVYDIEFVSRTFNAKPWSICGTSILFPDWAMREQADTRMRRQLNVSDVVDFVYDGEPLRGIISSIRKRATVTVPTRGVYYIPLHLLTKVN